MGCVDSSNNENTFKYALALAIKKHLQVFRSRLTSRIEIMADKENAIKTQYQLTDLDVVVEYGLEAYLEQVKEVISVSSKDADALAFKLDRVLLGPDINLYDVSNNLTTEDVIRKIERSDDRVPFITLSRESQLSERLYLILQEVIQLNDDTFKLGNLNAFDTLSAYSVSFISQATTQLPASTKLLNLVSEKIKNVDTLLQGSYYNANIDTVYPFFKKFLISHINLLHIDLDNESSTLLVSKLREQGNNLMANLAFAQAIQVYTQAFDVSTIKTVSQIPQILTNRAIAYIGLNCFPEAIMDLNQAVNYDWQFTPAWAQLGYCQLYMGNSLTALKSYLFALKTSVGEVGGKKLSPAELEEYKQLKIKTVLPQFVQRLCLAIALTERRAYQQSEPELEIRSVISEVRRILAKLRAEAQTEDERQYFTYLPQLREPGLISRSERANRMRPNILTPDVSQNMLATNGMESVTVTASPFDRRVDTTTRDAAANTNTTTNANTPPSLDRGTNTIREFMNEFGDMLEGTRPNLANPRVPTTVSGTTPTNVHRTLDPAINNDDMDPEISSPTERRSSMEMEAGIPESDRARHQNMLSEVLRGVIPGIGNVISQFATGTNGSRVIINGQEISNGRDSNNGANRNTNAAGTTSATSRESTTREDEDVEMPEQEDLD